MKFMLSLLALGYVASAIAAPSLPVNPGGIGGLFKGPNSETIIKGPDGSVITAAAEGGEVQSGLAPIVVAEPALVEEGAPVVPVPVAPIATVPVAPVIEAVAVPAPAVESKQSSDLIGPSGRIATEGSHSVIAGPSSTTVAGPAVVAETIVKGPPIVGTPILNAAVPATAQISTVTAAPVTLTGPGLIPGPVTSVTVSPLHLPSISTLAPALGPVSVTPRVDLGPTIITPGVPSIATVTPPVAIVTPTPQAVATASLSPHLSVASASSGQGASAIASAAPNRASAAVETPLQLPVVPSTAGPILINGQGLVGINDRIDFTPQLVQDQIAIDNRQLILNPPVSAIPPEIVVTPKTIPGRFRPTPGTLLTTPGLGAVASSTNIQREEGDIALSVTPNTLQPQTGLTPQQLLALQNQQTLLNNQIQHAQEAAGPGVLTPQQPVQIQERGRTVLAASQEAANAQLVASNQQLLQNLPPGKSISLNDVQQQQILSAELAKAGIDATQLQLTSVPLSSVTALELGGGINDGLAWNRYGRDAENKKKTTEKKKTD